MVCGLYSGAAFAILSSSKTPFVHEQIESPNTSLQRSKLNPNYLKPAHFNRPGTDHETKNTEPLKVLHVSARVCLLGNMDAYARLFNNFHAAGTNKHLAFSLS